MSTSRSLLSFLNPGIQRRTLCWTDNKDALKTKPRNPLSEEFLKKKPSQQAPVRGDLASSSIFADEELAGQKSHADKEGKPVKLTPRNPKYMAAALDPDPTSRVRWERKMVIREVRKRGRLNRAQRLKREERVLISKSHNFRTSVKKLVPLAKQITGKTVDEAIIQMRFSKKKNAAEVKKQLEQAKNEAIVSRGMGLGLQKGLGLKEGESFRPILIQDKKGKRIKVSDPTTMYVEQAWCGKGLYGKSPDYRARGQTYIMKNRTSRKFREFLLRIPI